MAPIKVAAVRGWSRVNAIARVAGLVSSAAAGRRSAAPSRSAAARRGSPTSSLIRPAPPSAYFPLSAPPASAADGISDAPAAASASSMAGSSTQSALARLYGSCAAHGGGICTRDASKVAAARSAALQLTTAQAPTRPVASTAAICSTATGTGTSAGNVEEYSRPSRSSPIRCSDASISSMASCPGQNSHQSLLEIVSAAGSAPTARSSSPNSTSE